MTSTPTATITAFVLAAANALAQAPPDYGFQWATIGAAGNRPANQHEAPLLFEGGPFAPMTVGAVGYEYRISRTEVTNDDWAEFLNAYVPYYDGEPRSTAFTGLYIRWINNGPGQPYTFEPYPVARRFAVEANWRLAARYCNWLHNGKSPEAWAFESGAYDTSTFFDNSDLSFNDQRSRSPGATYWLPSLDEWTKAMHYDPNKHGPGQEGYWLYPTTSDTPPIAGYPWEGGQTNAGVYGPQEVPWLPVGSYPDVMSPWGLWDGSGGLSEMTESVDGEDIATSRWVRGSRLGGEFYYLDDRIDGLAGVSPRFGFHGFRIASAVPAPTTLSIFLFIIISMGWRASR